MSDLAAQHDDGVFEPDEETLMSAFRNQDDIPILMDIVTDQASFSVSQEAHLAQPFDDLEDESISHKRASDEASIEEVSVEAMSSLNPSQALIAKAIADVLEKRLPELVMEVVQALHAADRQKHDTGKNNLEE
jgi:hypothetical protein